VTALAAAFGEQPGTRVRVSRGGPPLERWLVAVALGGQGWYAAAATLLEDLVTAPGVPRAVAAHAAVTLASHRRQLGGHAVARAHDAAGLRLAAAAPVDRPDAAGTDALAARIDALVGLAADAVGTGDTGAAERLLRRAGPIAGDHPSWRPAVRLGWVRAELALVRGAAEEAVAPAREALERAVVGGSTRHVLKSRIVHAVARAAAGGAPGEALAVLDAVADEAERSGLLPLVWPARYAAADIAERGSEGLVAANEHAARTAERSVNGLTSGSPRRRHAGMTTVSVIRGRCDSLGRRLMGESPG
jgi:hypothetical protein